MIATPAPDTLDLAPLEAILERFEGRTGALIPILQATQSVYGYLPREALELIAERLNVSMGKIYGVATFYAQFYLEKRGLHILRVCDGTACHVKGATHLVTAVTGEYGIEPGETTQDGQLTMEIVYCIGSCALAPVAVMDDQVVGRVKEDDLLRRLNRHVAA
jgi:NADH-quinone oxidoreductase subunit E